MKLATPDKEVVGNKLLFTSNGEWISNGHWIVRTDAIERLPALPPLATLGVVDSTIVEGWLDDGSLRREIFFVNALTTEAGDPRHRCVFSDTDRTMLRHIGYRYYRWLRGLVWEATDSVAKPIRLSRRTMKATDIVGFVMGVQA